MRKLLMFLCAATLVFAMAVSSVTNAATILDTDFESGASGWSNNTTTNGGANFTTFLGRFAGDYVFQDFTLSGSHTAVTLAFDMYEIDSWDNELFGVSINNVPVVINQHRY